MKTWISLTAMSLCLLLLSGCASNGTAYGNPPQQQQSIVVNGKYVAVVEEIAKQRGTRVVWVNKPVKRVPTSVASAD